MISGHLSALASHCLHHFCQSLPPYPSLPTLPHPPSGLPRGLIGQAYKKRPLSLSLPASLSEPCAKVPAISCPLASKMTSLDGRGSIFELGSESVMTQRKRQNATLNEYNGKGVLPPTRPPN